MCFHLCCRVGPQFGCSSFDLHLICSRFHNSLWALRGSLRALGCILHAFFAYGSQGMCMAPAKQVPSLALLSALHTAAGFPSTPVATARICSMASSNQVHGSLCTCANTHGCKYRLLLCSVITLPSSNP